MYDNWKTTPPADDDPRLCYFCKQPLFSDDIDLGRDWHPECAADAADQLVDEDGIDGPFNRLMEEI